MDHGACFSGHTTNALPPDPRAAAQRRRRRDAGALQPPRKWSNTGAKADFSRVLLHVAPAATTPLTPLDTLLVPCRRASVPAGATSSKLCSRDAAFRDEMKKYCQDAAFISVGLLYLCKKTMADYPSQVGDAHERRHVVRPHRQPAAAHLRRRRAHAPARCRHPHRAEPGHAARADAAAHPALGLPLAGRVLPRASRRRARPATRSA